MVGGLDEDLTDPQTPRAIEGESLRARLGRGPLPWAEARRRFALRPEGES